MANSRSAVAPPEANGLKNRANRDSRKSPGNSRLIRSFSLETQWSQRPIVLKVRWAGRASQKTEAISSRGPHADALRADPGGEIGGYAPPPGDAQPQRYTTRLRAGGGVRRFVLESGAGRGSRGRRPRRQRPASACAPRRRA